MGLLGGFCGFGGFGRRGLGVEGLALVVVAQGEAALVGEGEVFGKVFNLAEDFAE